MISQLLAFLSILLLYTLNSFANPLHGIYTIGTGGNYTQISDAVAALDSHGIAGPVTFKILSGTYTGTNYFREVSNSNSSNTITFESFANDPDSVVINDPSEYSFRIEGAKNLILINLTLQNITMNGICQNIHITNNKFTDHTIQMIDGQILGFYVQGNSALAGITINSHEVQMQAVTISYNDFSPLASYIILNNVHNVSIEVNKNLGNLFMDFVNTVEVSANKLKSNQPGSNILQIRESQIVYVKNNFFDSQGDAWGISLKDNNLLDFKNNTVRNEGLDTTLLANNNTGLELLNNIYYNDSPSVSVSLWNNTGFNSDYNMYYNGPDTDIIWYNGLPYTLAGFQTASGEDLNSWNYPATFADSTDLHLHKSQGGNDFLLGIPDPDVTVDIDGEPRHALYPYKGADELAEILPVELSSFTSSVTGNSVSLVWTTSSEYNNSGFAIEKSIYNYQLSMFNDQWYNVGFVNGNGTTSSSKNYEFTDRNLSSGKYKYRLKQIDYNGNFTYYNLSGEVVIGVPHTFSLSQNYPNPFNPETKISYDLPSEEFVSLYIYDMTGREVAKLVNEIQSAGRYHIRFNAGNLSSGIYYLKMKAGEFTDVKRMMLVK